MRTKLLRKIKLALGPLLLFLTLALSLAPLLPVLAGNAVLYLSPSSGTKYVGSSFSVSVRVNSGSHSTNAYKAVVKFPTALLQATSVSVGASICTLQITGSPSFSNGVGSVNFECGHPGSFSGSSGPIGTVTFIAKAPGTAKLTFTTANVKAADGYGTEVLGSTSGATFTLQPAPISGPVVSSTTHPDPNLWYSNKDIELSWTTPSGADGFSYILNGSSGTVPDEVSEGTATTRSYFDNPDGVLYFHIRAHNSNGWGTTTHFRLQTDTTPPNPFEVTSDPPAENVTAAPLIIARATDATSGVDHYEIALDAGSFAAVSGMPYQLERITEGTHTITVRAVDKAGNYRDSSLVLHVVDIEDPRITSPADGAYIPILEQLEIRGTAPAGLVELYLNDELIAQVESDGSFAFDHTAFLRPGQYRLKAIAITDRGIASSPAEITFTVDPRAVSLFGFTLPGWLVYSTLLGIIITLLILLFRYLRKVSGFDDHVLKDVRDIEEEAEKDLERAEQELKQAVDDVLEDGDLTQIHQLEHELERRIEKAEGEARDRIKAELDRIRRHHPASHRRWWRRVFIFDWLARLWLIVFGKRKKKKEEEEAEKAGGPESKR